MITLRDLEERLERAMPSWTWKCQAAHGCGSIDGTEVPEEIEVSATRRGVPVSGSPWHVSGGQLVRWGLDTDTITKLICRECSPEKEILAQQSGPHWDKLAEI